MVGVGGEREIGNDSGDEQVVGKERYQQIEIGYRRLSGCSIIVGGGGGGRVRRRERLALG